MCIFLLGRFEVTRGDRVLHASTWTRRKAAALLQRLAVERRLLKEQAIEFLWPEHDPTTGANNLYRTLHQGLRQLPMVLIKTETGSHDLCSKCVPTISVLISKNEECPTPWQAAWKTCQARIRESSDGSPASSTILVICRMKRRNPVEMESLLWPNFFY